MPDAALPSEMPRGSAGSSAACTAGRTKPPLSQWGTAIWRRPGGGGKKANEKAGWHHNTHKEGPAGKRGMGHLPRLLVCPYSTLDVKGSSLQPVLQSHLLSRAWPQGILKIPCGLSSLYAGLCNAPAQRGAELCNTPASPYLLMDKAAKAQSDARFSKMCPFCFIVIFGTLSPTFQAKR